MSLFFFYIKWADLIFYMYVNHVNIIEWLLNNNHIPT